MKDSGLGAPCTSFPTSFCPRTGDVTGDGGTVVNPNPLQAIGTIPEQWRGSEDTAQKQVSSQLEGIGFEVEGSSLTLQIETF